MGRALRMERRAEGSVVQLEGGSKVLLVVHGLSSLSVRKSERRGFWQGGDGREIEMGM